MSSVDRNYNEKRDFIRMKINSPVTISCDGTEYQGICKDLSGAGMLIATEHAFESGNSVNVYIEAKGDNHLPFDATAEISRVDANGDDGYIVGLSIKEIR